MGDGANGDVTNPTDRARAPVETSTAEPLDEDDGWAVELSPLWLVSRAPALNALVMTLQRALADDAAPYPRRVALSRAQLTSARVAFVEMIQRGERALYELAGLVASSVLREYVMHSVVIGEVEGSQERFTLSVDTSFADLYAHTDLDIGQRILERIRFVEGDRWARASLVSNAVEYEAVVPNDHHVYRMMSRIKAEEEIWNKVVDEIFNLDTLVLRDKELRHMSRYVKDVFGLKIVTATQDDAYKLQAALAMMRWSRADLAARELPVDDDHDRLTFLEVKDYLRRASRKHTGWKALKSVVRWAGRTFEIQVQPLANFLHERERLTRESHSSFKSNRERVRDEVAARLPLFAYTRSLLRWAFVEQRGPPPAHPAIEVVLED